MTGGPVILRTALATAFASALAAAPAIALEKRVPQGGDEVVLSFAPLVRQAAPAVVNIYARKRVRASPFGSLFDDPFFRRFFGEDFGFRFDRPRRRPQNSLGSGVIVRADGLVVTNNHVIAGADEITVVLADRREFAAAILGTDERTDLAVLRLQGIEAGLPYLELRDSDELEVGDLVLAIGNPFGVGQTVTSGIVSALARTGVGGSDLNFFIQTDAAINPGNSGGALVSLDGRLVGINTAIFSKSGGSLGIGFAIPSNMVRSVINGITRGGPLVRPWLGAWGQDVSADIAQSIGLERPRGVLINDVYPGVAADRAGLRVGDVLLAVNGREVNDPQALKYRIATLEVGASARLDVWRRGRPLTLTLRLAPPPEVPPRDVTDLGGRQPLAGATVANMSPALAEELGLERVDPGVVILKLRRGSAANRLGFRPTDRVLAVNDEETESVAKLKSQVMRSVERWRITVERDGKPISLVINR